MKRKSGRPKKYPGVDFKCTGIYFPSALIPKIDAAAKRENSNRSSLVVAAIAAYIGESPFQPETMPNASTASI